MEDEYLTVAEVSKRLRVTRQAIYNWIAEGRLRAVKVGRGIRIPVSSLVEFLRPVAPGERIEDEEDMGPVWAMLPAA